ncbi:MAG: helix-turn-helix domain-containing protein [Spirochaetia bacterium]|nr:helix-turn-helix domain-containing protein [Spirochaetia bacterium]MCF7946360.1 helix-turn-helix domain-containing protein [Spirochaetia bacterium]
MNNKERVSIPILWIGDSYVYKHLSSAIAIDNPQINIIFTKKPNSEETYDLIILSEEFLETALNYISMNHNTNCIIIGNVSVFRLCDFFKFSDAVLATCTSDELLYKINKYRRKKYFDITNTRFYFNRKCMFTENNTIEITSSEYELLQIFSFFPNICVSRGFLKQQICKKGVKENSRSLDVCMFKLRKKVRTLLNIEADKVIFKTIHGKGYMICGNK